MSLPEYQSVDNTLDPSSLEAEMQRFMLCNQVTGATGETKV